MTFKLHSLLVTTVWGLVITASSQNQIWNVKNFDNLVTFGDSYTDESRVLYFISHNGTAPPAGMVLPENLAGASGGRTWPRYVVQYTGSTDNGSWTPQLSLYNYAVAGACCSQEITPRDYPPVLEYQVPAFRADLQARRTTSNTTVFTKLPTDTNTAYSLWIGGNDLGAGTFLTNEQTLGKVLTDFTECVYRVFDRLYASGARIFVLMNTVPLDLTPMYANSSLYGTTGANSTYWPNKPANGTAVAEQIREYTTSVNTIFKYQTAFEARIACRYPGASFALFDTHSLITDIYNDPASYFNGTQPADPTRSERVCDNVKNSCVLSYNGTSSDSFMWFDTLHPSTQTDRIIAKNFVDVLNGVSKYATYY